MSEPCIEEQLTYENPLSRKMDYEAEPIGTKMEGYDIMLLGPKPVIIDALVVDLLNVDTSSQTFQIKLQATLDWEDDGVIAMEKQQKRSLRISNTQQSFYTTGNYCISDDFIQDPENLCFNPCLQLENAIKGDESLHKSPLAVRSLHDRPVLSQQFAFQPVCRCNFTFGNFPFDETDLVVKFTSSR